MSIMSQKLRDTTQVIQEVKADLVAKTVFQDPLFPQVYNRSNPWDNQSSLQRRAQQLTAQGT